jgi:hypothetical protein
MAQTNVRDLFDLQPTEQIYDDFSCSLGALAAGRMYLTENYICFFRTLIGMQKKIKVRWVDIQEIDMKNKEIKIIASKEKDSPITFSGFSDFRTTSKYVAKLWNAARGVESD